MIGGHLPFMHWKFKEFKPGTMLVRRRDLARRKVNVKHLKGLEENNKNYNTRVLMASCRPNNLISRSVGWPGPFQGTTKQSFSGYEHASRVLLFLYGNWGQFFGLYFVLDAFQFFSTTANYAANYAFLPFVIGIGRVSVFFINSWFE